MTKHQQMDGEEATTVQTNEPQPQSPWLAVAPLVAWWWVVLAIAVALIIGDGFLKAVQVFAKPLGILILGIAIAASLSPMVTLLNRLLPRMVSVILIYLALLLSLLMVSWIAVPPLVSQIQSFVDESSQIVNQAQAWITRWASSDSTSIVRAATFLLSSGVVRLLSLPITVGESFLQVLLILFISFYSLIVAQDVHNFILSLVPEHRRQQTAHILGNMNKAMGGYVRGVALSSVTVGVFAYLGLLALGVDYPLLLALLAAVLEILPILGTLISTVLIVTIALLQSPQLGLLALTFMVILQQIQGNIIFPNVISNQTHISPLLSILAFFAGGVVGGLLGALVAIPLAAALRVLMLEIVAPMVRRWTGAKKSASSQQDYKNIHAAPQ